MSDLTRIVVLRANALGDFVLTLPALAALRVAHPEARITLLGTAMHQQLLDDRPGPWDRVVVVPPYPGVVDRPGASRESPEVLRFLEQQRSEGYDLAVQLHGGGAGSNPLVASLGARLSIGARDAGAPGLDRTVPYAAWQHEVLRQLEVLALADVRPARLEPVLAVTEADRTAARAVLPEEERPLVAVHAGAADPRRRWPGSAFGAVARALADRGARVVIVGRGPEDAATAATVAAAMRTSPVDLVDRLALGGTIGVLERCALLVANDSGPRHLAAAVATPTVGIFRAANLVTAGPVTRAHHRVAVSQRIDCPSCGADQSRQRCAHNPSFVTDVPVEEVLDAAVELYDDRRQSPGRGGAVA